MMTDQSVKNEAYYKSRSFWLEDSQDSLVPRQALQGNKTVDIAIMGAGFSGLWTAYYLLETDPSLDIAIVEKEIAGFGASGRNGGWCTPTFPVSPDVAIERYGIQATHDLYQALFATISEFERVVQKEALTIDWAQDGSLVLALGKHGIPALEDTINLYKQIGLEHELTYLEESGTRERINVAGAVASVYTRRSAVLQPGKLTRQLARLLEGKGVTIYEQSEVVEIKPSDNTNKAALITQEGELQARHAILVTGEAYLSQMKAFKRQIIPMYSLINLTEPLSAEQWEAIGWRNRETVGSTRYSVNYLQRTADGRILFGGRGQPYRFGSRIDDSLDQHEPTNNRLRNMLVEWFPMLKDIKITHKWGGPVGITRDWTPNITFDKATRLGTIFGYGGQGVATANLAGRLMRDLILERTTELTELPIVQHHSRKWEPEPIRWLGARFVQKGLERVDRKAETTGIPPTGKTLAERLGKH